MERQEFEQLVKEQYKYEQQSAQLKRKIEDEILEDEHKLRMFAKIDWPRVRRMVIAGYGK